MIIAIVDEDAGILHYYKEILSHLEVDIFSCPLLAAKDIPLKIYDVIILDWSMPIMDGGELLDTLRISGVSSKFIFNTSVTDEDILSLMLEMGVHDIVFKGHDLASVLDKINIKK